MMVLFGLVLKMLNATTMKCLIKRCLYGSWFSPVILALAVKIINLIALVAIVTIITSILP